MTVSRANPLHELSGVDTLPRRVTAGNMSAMRFMVMVLTSERSSRSLDDRRLGHLWMAMRCSVPLLVSRALGGNMEAVHLLHMIRRHLDPYIGVPWRDLPPHSRKDLDGPPDDGVEGYALILRLRRCLDEVGTPLPF